MFVALPLVTMLCCVHASQQGQTETEHNLSLAQHCRHIYTGRWCVDCKIAPPKSVAVTKGVASGT